MVSCSITHLHYDDGAPWESEQGKDETCGSFSKKKSPPATRRFRGKTAVNENTLFSLALSVSRSHSRAPVFKGTTATFQLVLITLRFRKQCEWQ